MSLKSKLLNLTKYEGLTETDIDGLHLYRISKNYPKTSVVSPLAICFVIQGQKTAYIGSKKIDYAENSYLISSVNMPIESELKNATKENPYLGIVLYVNPTLINELLLVIDNAGYSFNRQNTDVLMTTSYINNTIDENLNRLLSIVDDPLKVKVLGKAIMREMLFNILMSDKGYILRNCVANNANAHKMAHAIQYIEQNFKESIEVQDIAKHVGMSKSALHEHFKEATSLSPIQFIKNLRIHNAYNLIQQGHRVGEAALRSGYNNQAQFSREFKRHFKCLPSDIKFQ